MPTPKPKRVGRPVLPKGDAKAVMLRVRLTPAELKGIEVAAKSADKTVSEWIRQKLFSVAEA